MYKTGHYLALLSSLLVFACTDKPKEQPAPKVQEESGPLVFTTLDPKKETRTDDNPEVLDKSLLDKTTDNNPKINVPLVDVEKKTTLEVPKEFENFVYIYQDRARSFEDWIKNYTGSTPVLAFEKNTMLFGAFLRLLDKNQIASVYANKREIPVSPQLSFFKDQNYSYGDLSDDKKFTEQRNVQIVKNIEKIIKDNSGDPGNLTLILAGGFHGIQYHFYQRQSDAELLNSTIFASAKMTERTPMYDPYQNIYNIIDYSPLKDSSRMENIGQYTEISYQTMKRIEEYLIQFVMYYKNLFPDEQDATDWVRAPKSIDSIRTIIYLDHHGSFSPSFFESFPTAQSLKEKGINRITIGMEAFCDDKRYQNSDFYTWMTVPVNDQKTNKSYLSLVDGLNTYLEYIKSNPLSDNETKVSFISRLIELLRKVPELSFDSDLTALSNKLKSYEASGIKVVLLGIDTDCK